jgi:hypothetical protein
MMPDVSLQANGFAIYFEFTSPSRTDEGWFEYNLSLAADDFTIHKRGSLARRDIVRLASYLRQHVGANRPHEIDDAEFNYVPLELDFEIRGYAGEIESWENGAFTLSIMISRDLNDGNGRVYRGVMGTTGTAEVLQFCDKLEYLAARD